VLYNSLVHKWSCEQAWFTSRKLDSWDFGFCIFLMNFWWQLIEEEQGSGAIRTIWSQALFFMDLSLSTILLSIYIFSRPKNISINRQHRKNNSLFFLKSSMALRNFKRFGKHRNFESTYGLIAYFILLMFDLSCRLFSICHKFYTLK